MRKTIAIYTLTSELHNEQAVSQATHEFLGSLGFDFDFRGSDFSDYGTHALSLIYIRTGGTEGIFRCLLPELQKQSNSPFYLLTSGKSNSLAASMEILSFLRQHNLKGEIIHGSANYINHRVSLLAQVGEARRKLNDIRLGIIGKPSDWLISSTVDADMVKERLGINLVEVQMQELLELIGSSIEPGIEGALRIYDALKVLVERHNLQGFTLRCFDLLSAVHNTGCMALARINAERLQAGTNGTGMGYVAGCEGDVPAMLSMMIVRALLGISGFQANPSTIDPETGKMIFAHCTIPLDMVEHYELDTHYESGIGVGIRGYMKEGPVTIFKVSGNLQRHFLAEGTLLRNEAKPDLCRTQQVIRLNDKCQTAYFLTNPIGNHHIIVPGHHQELIENMLFPINQ